MRTAGLSPARIPQLRERLAFMRALLNGQGSRRTCARPKKQSRKHVGTCGSRAASSVPSKWRAAVRSSSRAWASTRLRMAAASSADGVIVDGTRWAGNGEGARATVKAAREGAAKAGKDAGKLRFIAAIDAAMDDDRRKALDRGASDGRSQHRAQALAPRYARRRARSRRKGSQRIVQVLRTSRPDGQASRTHPG